jgi:cytochrome c biogenesis protein CcdA
MIDQITPLVQEAGRRTWLCAVASHTLGSTLSGGVLGFALGTVGLGIGLAQWKPITEWLFIFILLLCALRDAGIIRLRLPSLRRQTPAWCPQVLGSCWGAFAWGVDLGQGWTTLISFASYYALLVWAVIQADPMQGALVLGIYGAGRALPVLIAGLNLRKADGLVCSLWYAKHQPLLYMLDTAALSFAAGFFLLNRF